MQLDLPTILLIFITSCVCITGFIGVVILYVIGVKRGMQESDRVTKAAQRFVQNNRESVPVATRLLVSIYILISLSVFIALLVVFAVVVAYQMGLPLVNNISVRTLGLISALVLLVATIATLILRFLFGRIFK